MSSTIIEIKPHRNGGKVFEASDVEPVFPEKRQAISYAQRRACFRSGEVRILDSGGNVERRQQLLNDLEPFRRNSLPPLQIFRAALNAQKPDLDRESCMHRW